jgi:hypothetical protein
MRSSSACPSDGFELLPEPQIIIASKLTQLTQSLGIRVVGGGCFCGVVRIHHMLGARSDEVAVVHWQLGVAA